MSLEIQPLSFYLLIIFQVAQLSLALTPVQNPQSPLQQSFPSWQLKPVLAQQRKTQQFPFGAGCVSFRREDSSAGNQGDPCHQNTPRVGGKGEKTRTINQHWFPGSPSGSYSVPEWTLGIVAKEIREPCVIDSCEDWKKRDKTTLPQNLEVHRRHCGFIAGYCPRAAENKRGSICINSASPFLEWHGVCNPLLGAG